MPALPAWLTEPLWDQFVVLLPERPEYHPDHPLGCHRRRISDRIIFDTMLRLLRFGCSYEAIAGTTCSATTIRSRRDEWIRLGVFARLEQIALDAYWVVFWPAPTAVTPRCSPRPWTAWTTWVRCPTRSPSTWTPATTRTRPARCSTNAVCTAASRTKARRRPSRPVSAGTSNAPVHGGTPSTGSPAATSGAPRRQRIVRPRRHDHHRARPDPAGMDDAPDGRTPEPPTMTRPLFRAAC